VGAVDRDDTDGCRSRGGSASAMSDNNSTLSSLGVALRPITQMGMQCARTSHDEGDGSRYM
jgi:hypothetical protein